MKLYPVISTAAFLVGSGLYVLTNFKFSCIFFYNIWLTFRVRMLMQSVL